MGNSQPIKINAETTNLELSGDAIREFRRHIALVDHAVTGLAKAIDTMLFSCDLFLEERNVSKAEKGTDDDTIEVLKKLLGCISKNKAAVLHTVASFLNLVLTYGKRCIEFTDDTGSIFAVSKHLLGLYEEPDKEWESDFFYKRITYMKNQIDFIKNQEELNRSTIRNFKERERILLKNIAELKEEVERKDRELRSPQQTPTVVFPKGNLDFFSVEKESREHSEGHSQTGKTSATKRTHISHTEKIPVQAATTTTDHLARTAKGVETSKYLEKRYDHMCINAQNLENTEAPNTNREFKHTKSVITDAVCQQKNDKTDFSTKLSSIEKRVQQREGAHVEAETGFLHAKKEANRLDVQWYHPSNFSKSTIEEEIINKLRDRMKRENTELAVRNINWVHEADVDKNILIVGLKEHFNRPFRSIKDMLQKCSNVNGCKASVIILHCADDGDVHRQADLFDKNWNSSYRVFHLGFDKSLQRSSFNETTLENITIFLKKSVLRETRID